MSRNKFIDLPASSDDDDSISLTSTAPSEPKDEYPIEGILAERVDDGTNMYLVKWAGYPDERCTWEPASSFQDEQTFHDWQNRKMRISRSLELPYDVGALEIRVENWLEAAAKRKARRRAKRVRLGLSITPEPEGDDSDYNSSEVLEENDDSEPDRPLKKRRGSSTSVNRGKDNPDEGESRKWTPKEEAALKSGLELVKGPFWHKILGLFGTTGTTSRDLKDMNVLDLEAKTLKLEIDYLKSGRDVPQYLQFAKSDTRDRVPGNLESTDRKHQSELLSDVYQSKPSEQRTKELDRKTKSQQEARNSFGTLKPKVSIAQMTPRVKPAEKTVSNRKHGQMGIVGTGPLRMGQGDRKLKSAGKKPKVSGAAILGNWNASVRPRGKKLPLQNAASTVDNPPERFGKLSIKRRFEKAGRNERAPDFDSLTLRNPKEFHVVRKPSVSSPVTKGPTKPPFETYRESLAEGREESWLSKSSTLTSTVDVVETPADAFDQEEQSLELDGRTNQKIGATATSASLFPTPGIPAPDFPTPVLPTPQFQSSKLSIPAFLGPNHPATSATYGSQKPHFVAYNAHDPYQVNGTIKVGLNGIDQGDVRFRGFELSAKRLLIGIKSAPRGLFVWFKHSIVAEDYKAYFHTVAPVVSIYREPVVFSGYIAPFQQAEGNIRKMAETLKMHVSGGLFLTKKFTLLVYPSGSEDWTFLDDQLPICPPEAVLRCVMGKPCPGLIEEEPQKPLSDSTEQEPQNVISGSIGEELQNPLPSLTYELPVVSVRDGESNTNAVFRNMYNVEFSRLVAPATSAETTEMYNFFLIFPPSKETERDAIIDFLQHNKATEILSYETKGAWDYFSTRINAGVIIIHEDFFDLWRIPDLARVLRKNINVWNFNMTPSSLAPDPHLNRLFPHGAAVLLTDGLFLHQPHEAAKILTWFRLIVLNSKAPRTWKLCSRPRLKDWLLTLQADRTMEDGKVYVQCYGEVWRILKDEYMEQGDPEEEQPTPEAPMCFMGEVSAFDENVGKGVATNAEVDKETIAQNDKVLVEWFAGYAMTKLEYFRRFDIVIGAPLGNERHQELKDKYQSKWSHIEIVTAEELYRKHKVPDWDVLNKEEEKRVRSIKKRWAEEDAANAVTERVEVQRGKKRGG